VPPADDVERRSARGRHMVGVVARLVPEKGVDVFIRAAALMWHGLPGVSFVIVGDGPEAAALERLAERLGIRERIGFLGARAEAQTIIRRLDIICVPSRTARIPLVVLEAMALGIPIVASDVGGIPELVTHRRHALLVPPGDPFALASAVRTLIGRPTLARRLADSAFQRSQTELSPAHLAQRMVDIYRMAREGGTPQPVPVAAAVIA
jgi:glycosyltransferase involved in cell wall biosynthesis